MYALKCKVTTGMKDGKMTLPLQAHFPAEGMFMFCDAGAAKPLAQAACK